MNGLHMRHAAVFLDKDGTLLEDVPYNVDPSQMRFTSGTREALALLAAHGFKLIVVSNQPGVAHGMFALTALRGVQMQLARMFGTCGAELTAAYWCPHHPDGIVARYTRHCRCRKPAPGMLLRAAREHAIDLASSWFVGDILDDVEAGNRAGCRSILLDNGHETEWRPGPHRVPHARTRDLYGAALTIVEARARQERAAPLAEVANSGLQLGSVG